MHDPVHHTLNPSTRIPFLSGRPRRVTVIDGDDLANLRIALGLHRDVLELRNDTHLFSPFRVNSPGAESHRTHRSTASSS